VFSKKNRDNNQITEEKKSRQSPENH